MQWRSGDNIFYWAGEALGWRGRRAFDADWRYWLDGRVVTGDNGNLGLFGEVLYEYFGSDIQDSPIARNNFEAEVGVGFI